MQKYDSVPVCDDVIKCSSLSKFYPWPRMTLNPKKKVHMYVCTYIRVRKMSRKTNEEISNIIFQDNICCCLPPPSFALTTNEKRQSPCFLFRFNDPIYFLVIFFYVKMKYKFSKQNVPSPPRKNASHTVSISDLNDLIYFHEILCSHFCYGF